MLSHIYVCVCVCVCMYVHVYVYICLYLIGFAKWGLIRAIETVFLTVFLVSDNNDKGSGVGDPPVTQESAQVRMITQLGNATLEDVFGNIYI